ncbi:MAG TPA: CHAD domain-containing protein [Anaerolineae bacterium]|nr:CHAD domain-containing protein [Anaerolineae bacterium]HQH38298.1 CHAD domain-containing protein [Anaerolineae bacterium]
MEIEAKFAIQNAQAYARVQAMDSIGRFSMAEEHVYDLHDTYFDTPDRKIWQAGYACRQREQDGSRIITLKAWRGAAGVVHRREEWEMNLPTATAVPASPGQWPDSAVRQQTLALTGGALPTPLFSLKQRRRARSILYAQRLVAELSLDTVTLSPGGSDQPFMELEIELKGEGTEADLAAILDCLTDIPGLLPEPLSKFERGLAALDAAPPGITPDDTIAEAARKTLRFHLRRMMLNEEGTRAGKDPEALHAMRVATRRMRTAFRVFADALDTNTMAPYLKELRRTGRILGHVRDLDVFRAQAQAYLDTFTTGAPPDLSVLRRAWDAEYEYARGKMLKYFASRRYARFKSELATILDAPFPYTDTTMPCTQAIPDLVNRRLDEFYTCRARLERPDATLIDYHQMRIVTKNLRYTLEYCREVLSADVEQAIDKLKTLQNHLGALQDAVVASVQLHHVLAWGTWTAPGDESRRWNNAAVVAPDVAAYLAYQQAEIRRLVDSFPEAWRRFERTDFAQWIADALAALAEKPAQG